MAAFKQMGIELDLQPITKDTDLPPELLEKHKDDSNYKAMADEYRALSPEKETA